MVQKKLVTFIAVAAALGVVGIFWWGDIVGQLFPKTNQSAATVSSEVSTLTPVSVPEESLKPLDDGILIYDTTTGTGREANIGDLVSVHYIGSLADGTIFDSSIPRNTPLPFRVGSAEIIPGFSRGVVGMRVGGKRHIVLAPEVAYGAGGIKGPDGNYIIPPNATLLFEVELVSLDE